MRALFTISFLLFLHLFSYAQVTVDVTNPSPSGDHGYVRVYDPSDIGNKKAVGINYADMNGSPFWNDKWAPAFLYLKRGTVIKLKQVKMNLYTREVHYIDNNGRELAAGTEAIEKVVLLKAEDSTKAVAVFESHSDYTDNINNTYFRILNEGKIRLFVLQKVLVRQPQYNPLTGKQESGFFSKYYYAISSNGKITPLKSLDHNTVMGMIPFDTASETWLKENRNKLRNETEVVSFLNFYNGIHK